MLYYCYFQPEDRSSEPKARMYVKHGMYYVYSYWLKYENEENYKNSPTRHRIPHANKKSCTLLYTTHWIHQGVVNQFLMDKPLMRYGLWCNGLVDWGPLN